MNHGQEMRRVLLVEYNQGTAEAIIQMLAYPGLGGCEVIHVGELAEALKKLEQQPFDVVLLDLHLPDSWGLDTFLKLHTEFPDIAVVLLAAVDDENIACRAMEAGAEDYLLKTGLEVAVLQHCIGRAAHRHRAQQSRQGTIIGFLGAKGGVGATTVALNIATHIIDQQKTAAIIELGGGFGGLATELHFTPATNLSALLNVDPAAINEAIMKQVLHTTPFGLRVVFGPQHPEESRMAMDASHVETIVWTVGNTAECTILDLGCQTCAGTDAAIKLCNYVVLVLERDPMALSAAHMALDRLNLLGLSSMQIGAVIVNRSEAGISVDLREVQGKLNCEILGAIPLASDTCFRAIAVGEPIIIHEPESPAALALAEVGAKISAKNVLWKSPVPLRPGFAPPAAAKPKAPPPPPANGKQSFFQRHSFFNPR
jgi:MinD-like ATPase involved in chromosome partitioning or flagellar assembly/CheY-like chemotaxis protein